ncbi:BamA/TamA family outer membrane protein [Proteiniphilum saccharofermentans]|uniref:translocation and assembly module lipoprotein TamL n=1 Tax=Proteiniphilum saccharofermentans TaxID=1642647 RepID=UPI0028A770F2|nr:BamA/TamA family outer membrane protein [Proteiniphilum saccharofermentans]
MKKYKVLILWIFTLAACNVTKKVPEGSYLLNKTDIKSDVRGIGSSALEPYLRQKPNSSMILLGRVKLHMYNTPNDTSTWMNRQFLKYGEPPVLYNEQLAVISAEQIRLHLKNKGYLNAEVDTNVVKKDKKANVTYNVTGNEPHRIRTFTDTIHSVDTTIYNILNRTRQLELMKEGDLFDLSVLEEGRERMTTILRNRGYYNFLKDNFYFIADTTVGTNQVDVTLALNNPSDSTYHQRYYMGNVTVINGVDPVLLQDSVRRSSLELDTVNYRGIQVISEKDRFLRPRAVYYNTFLRPGRLYADRMVERTYASLNGMGPVNQTSINLTPEVRNDSAYIDSRITLYPGNLHYMRFGVDGTNSAGDLGVAGNVAYEHRNFLKGGETFRVQLNAAYEFITPSDSLNLLDNSFYEYGAEAFLSIPQLMLPWLMKRLRDQPSASTEFSAGINFQKRPEYLRQFFNLSTRFQWASMEWQLQHMLEPIGVTYVRMPWKSKRFEELYMDEDANPILRYSYDDLLIVRTTYNITYTNYNRLGRRSMPAVPIRVRSGIELAGWLPRIVTGLGGGKVNDKGFETFFKQPYSEYVKGDFDISASHAFDDKNTIAAHLAVGLAYPYGNSNVLPFEKRYFGGGANSVRGWSTRTLGPGTYSRDSAGSDFGRKIGDMKLDLSVEFRRKLTGRFELATFVDAGNIWTIRDYVEQPGGMFAWNSFYKELAVAYGLGLRLDLDFLLLRVDGGMKAHNPGLPAGTRWTIFKPNLRRDLAFHFAIGYPF